MKGRMFSRGPRIIAVAGNPEHLWSEQHGIKTRTKRNHSRTNSGRLTIGGNYSRSPLVHNSAVSRFAGLLSHFVCDWAPPLDFGLNETGELLCGHRGGLDCLLS